MWTAQIENIETVKAIIKDETELTHASPVVQEAAFIYCRTIAFLLRNTDISNKAQQAFEYAKSLCSHSDISAWLGIAKDKAMLFKQEQSDKEILRDLEVREQDGNLKESFILAFYFLLRANQGLSYDLALRHTIQLGGSTDSNACIVGGLIGAAVGFGGIQEEMRTKVLEFDCSNEDLAKM